MHPEENVPMMGQVRGRAPTALVLTLVCSAQEAGDCWGKQELLGHSVQSNEDKEEVRLSKGRSVSGQRTAKKNMSLRKWPKGKWHVPSTPLTWAGI